MMGNLKKHREIKHEGICYPCDQCDYNATEARALIKHREAKHKDIETDESPYIKKYRQLFNLIFHSFS